MMELAQALRHNAEHLASSIAFADDHNNLTWAHAAARVGGAMAQLDDEIRTIGVAGRNDVEWAITFLATWLAGKTIVPIPGFFSAEQIRWLVAEAGIELILESDGRGPTDNLRAAGVPIRSLAAMHAPLHMPRNQREGRLIIFTSGTTGKPKGVRLFSGQAMWSARTLAKVVRAHDGDRYLSLLPLSMLLEIICAILIPVLAGGSTFLAPEVAEAAATGSFADIARLFEQVRPTRSVMVPHLLAQYASELAALHQRPPSSLTFVAVGGAPLPAAVARAAERVGIPFFEGYGLSECASVVSLNLPGRSRRGTAGRPLPGLHVHIEDGEIVVQGPSVMDGYMHDATTGHRWRTGDIGELDADGYLRILGRKDHLLVTQTGRNIAPEWIESMVLGDERIAACVLTLSPFRVGPGMVLIPSVAGRKWFDSASESDIVTLLQQMCSNAPAHARPHWTIVISPEEAKHHKLLDSRGALQREAAARLAEQHHCHSRKQEEESNEYP